MIKKLMYYLFMSAVFAMMFSAVDIMNNKSVLGPENMSLANFGLNSLGFGGLNINNLLNGKFDLNGVNATKNTNAGEICSGKTPLLLADGSCVSCDYGAKSGADVLFGCEKCSNLHGVNCLVKMENKPVVQQKTTVSHVDNTAPAKSVSVHKYVLMNMVGAGDKLRATLTEVATGRKKIVFVGGVLDGATVKYVSVDGIVVEKNGVLERLDVGM